MVNFGRLEPRKHGVQLRSRHLRAHESTLRTRDLAKTSWTRHNLVQRRFQGSWHTSRDLVVTVSLGVADLSMLLEPTALALVEAADAALYVAKRNGQA